MFEVARIECAELDELRSVLEEAFWGSSGLFLNWLTMKLNTDRPAFERTVIQKDYEDVREFFEQQDRPEKRTGQMALL